MGTKSLIALALAGMTTACAQNELHIAEPIMAVDTFEETAVTVDCSKPLIDNERTPVYCFNGSEEFEVRTGYESTVTVLLPSHANIAESGLSLFHGERFEIVNVVATTRLAMHITALEKNAHGRMHIVFADGRAVVLRFVPSTRPHRIFELVSYNHG